MPEPTPATTAPPPDPAATTPPPTPPATPTTVQTDGSATRLSVDLKAEPPKLIANKYKDQPAFEAGIRELYKARGIPLAEGRELIGEKGRWSNTDEAVAEYNFLAANRMESAAGNPLADDDDLTGLLSKAGIKPDEFSARWLKEKKIAPEDLASIKKVAPWMTAKLGDQIVTSIYEAEQIKAHELARIQQAAKSRALEIAGGPEQLDTLRNKYLPSLPGPIKEDLNRRLADVNLYEGAMEELKRMYEKTWGGAASVPMVMGHGLGSGPPQITTSDELLAAMKARRSGDAAAAARIAATPPETIKRLQRKGN